MNTNSHNMNTESYTNIFEDSYKKYLGLREQDSLYVPITDLLGRGGKRLRPSLCFMACDLVGGDIKKAIPTAVCIELFHNFSLVHDDIEDDSKLRRGEPTLHIKYGLPIAVNAGDGLYALCYKALIENKRLLGLERAWEIFEEIAEQSIVLLEGQAMDLQFKDSREMDESEVIEVLRRKTAKLFAISAKCGAIAGGASYEVAEELSTAWEYIGIAFQIRDDILNIEGEEAKYGKRIGEDIAEGKPSLLLINCLEQCTASEKEKIYNCFHNYDKQEIEEVVNIFLKYDSLRYSEAIAMKYLRKGTETLKQIDLKSSGREAIRDKMVSMAEYFVEREK